MTHVARRAFGALAVGSLVTGALAAPHIARAQGGPVKIGYGISLSGPLAAAGRSAHIATELWRDDVNRRGGRNGRPRAHLGLDYN